MAVVRKQASLMQWDDQSRFHGTWYHRRPSLELVLQFRQTRWRNWRLSVRSLVSPGISRKEAGVWNSFEPRCHCPVVPPSMLNEPEAKTEGNPSKVSDSLCSLSFILVGFLLLSASSWRQMLPELKLFKYRMTLFLVPTVSDSDSEIFTVLKTKHSTTTLKSSGHCTANWQRSTDANLLSKHHFDNFCAQGNSPLNSSVIG